MKCGHLMIDKICLEKVDLKIFLVFVNKKYFIQILCESFYWFFLSSFHRGLKLRHGEKTNFIPFQSNLNLKYIEQERKVSLTHLKCISEKNLFGWISTRLLKSILWAMKMFFGEKFDSITSNHKKWVWFSKRKNLVEWFLDFI